MKRTFACLLTILGWSVFAVDLEQAYLDALENDPVLAGAIANNKISGENLWSGVSVLLPSVSASMNRGESDFERERGTGDEEIPVFIQEGKSQNASWNVNINQAIFNAQAIFQFLALRNQIKAADWDLIATEQALVLRVAQAYL
ncbi:MAG: TolC family protein, partial [Pseudomonadales bacterium]|nr:TolC family protein [Pseudomonadales bacterium]